MTNKKRREDSSRRKLNSYMTVLSKNKLKSSFFDNKNDISLRLKLDNDTASTTSFGKEFQSDIYIYISIKKGKLKVISSEASPTFGHANANFPVFLTV